MTAVVFTGETERKRMLYFYTAVYRYYFGFQHRNSSRRFVSDIDFKASGYGACSSNLPGIRRVVSICPGCVTGRTSIIS